MRILDLFCGAGGAGMGLHRAFPDAEITGVDIAPQKRYPFTFIQADALTYPLDGFDFVWASPPCQAFTIANHFLRIRGESKHVNLIPLVRNRLQQWGGHYVIENVVGAPLIILSRSAARCSILAYSGTAILNQTFCYFSRNTISIPVRSGMVNIIQSRAAVVAGNHGVALSATYRKALLSNGVGR